MLTKRLSYIVFFLGAMMCSAQDDDFVRGRVLDLESGQPVFKLDNFSDYWMNTPLPNIKN